MFRRRDLMIGAGARRLGALRVPAASSRSISGRPAVRLRLAAGRGQELAARPYEPPRSAIPTSSRRSTTTPISRSSSSPSGRSGPTAARRSRCSSSTSDATSRRRSGCTWSTAAARARSATTPSCSPSARPASTSKLPDDLGFAGFRVMDGPSATKDWLAYQGAATSAPPARSTSTASRRAASRSTPRCPGRRSSRASPSSGSSRRRPTARTS